MKLFSFNWDINIVYIIFYWLIDICIHLVLYLKDTRNSRKYSEREDITQLIYVSSRNISDLFAGFLVLYTKCVTKNKSKIIMPLRQTKSGRERSLIHEDVEINYQEKYFGKLIIITILDYISNSLYCISFAITKVRSEQIYYQTQIDIINTFDILLRYIFSIFILKIVVSRHRKFSIILIIIGFVILLPADFIFMYNNTDSDILPNTTLIHTGINFISVFCLPIKDILIQQIFNNKHILPHQLMFLKSLVETIILIIVIIILASFSVPVFPLNFGTNTILVFIGYILFVFFRSLIYLKIIYNLSAQSVSVLIIGRSLAGSLSEIINYSINNNEKTYLDTILLIIEFLGILIITFATLVYDEIIIIEKCNLDVDTKKGITKRSVNDLIQAIKTMRTPTEDYLREIGYDENEIEESKTYDNLNN